jgi:hypothetical protein
MDTGFSFKNQKLQLAKTLVPSYYCLYSLFNKIRNQGKIVSAGYWRGEKERVEWVIRKRVGAGRRNDPSIVCTYE